MIYNEVIENEEVVDINLAKEKKRAERRKKDFSKAVRKKDLSEQIHPLEEDNGVSQKKGLYENLHQYSKGRVKCGCTTCTGKSGGRHKHKKYISSKGMYSFSHAKGLDATDRQIREFSEFAV